MEKISCHCADKVTNEEVVQKMQKVQMRKYVWIGHILRQDSLLCDLMEGCWVKQQEEGNVYKNAT